jgi:hypothetical protein
MPLLHNKKDRTFILPPKICNSDSFLIFLLAQIIFNLTNLWLSKYGFKKITLKEMITILRLLYSFL